MSLRKNQLKKMTLDEIALLLAAETDPENIKLIHSYVAEKNNTLQERRTALNNEHNEVRAKIEKAVKNLNGRVRDRIEKRETVILDKDSRPTSTEITDLMALFAYLEGQGRIISRNNASIAELAESSQAEVAAAQAEAAQRGEFGELDRQFAELNSACGREQAIRDSLQRERDEKRAHYASIEQSIEQYRKEYERVEAAIRERERQFIQLKGYYDARTQEDRQKLTDLPAQSLQYEQQLLHAQAELNACRAQLDQRRILRIEAGQ